MRFSVGYELTEPVRDAILAVPEDAWVAALDQDGSARENGAGRRDHRPRRSRPLAGGLAVDRPPRAPAPRRPAVASPTTTATASKRSSPTSPTRRSRSSSAVTAQRAHVEDRIRDDKDTGLANLPFRDFAHNQVWLEIVAARPRSDRLDPALLLSRRARQAEPKRLRYRLLHVAGRLACSGRRAKLRLQHDWPWAGELAAAFHKLDALPAAVG